jgi:uncharacterized protein with GYD domain
LAREIAVAHPVLWICRFGGTISSRAEGSRGKNDKPKSHFWLQTHANLQAVALTVRQDRLFGSFSLDHCRPQKERIMLLSAARRGWQAFRSLAKAPRTGSNAMATYVFLNKFTAQGLSTIKDSPKRAEAFRGMAKNFGCAVKELLWMQGKYDIVAIVEAPDDATVAALAVSVAKLGNITTQTSRAFTMAEVASILEKVK